MNIPSIAISLNRFLLKEQCPEAWQGFDLYIFRDEATIFYAGQSHAAFTRVWDHLLNGFKGRSIIGRFVWCNWPKSMRFTIELLTSQAAQFNHVGNDPDAAEQLLIRQWSPCFNVSHNQQPTPLPYFYLPATAELRCSRRLSKLVREAERAVKAEDRQLWLQALD